MADNEVTGTGKAVATDKVTYSGDADQNVQLVRVVQVTGSEGSKTVVDLPGDATDGLLVNLGANNDVTVTGTVTVGAHAVTNAGTFAVQVDGAALTALQLIDDTVFADEAAFTLATSKVLAVGGYSVAHGSAPDALAAGGVGVLLMNRHRVPFVIGGHPNVVSYTHTAITTAVTDSPLIAVGAGSKIVVTGLTVTLDNASTVFPSVRIGFGTANVPALGNAGVLLAHGGLPAGGGVSRGDGSGILGVGGDAEDLRVTTVGNATGNGVQITVTYYLIES